MLNVLTKAWGQEYTRWLHSLGCECYGFYIHECNEQFNNTDFSDATFVDRYEWNVTFNNISLCLRP